MSMDIETLIPHDKALHALGGAVLFAVTRAVCLTAGLLPVHAGAAAMAAVAGVAVGKECYDLLRRDKHTPDARDAAFTIGGGLLGAASALSLT